jgi:hypothetical protein
VRGLLLALACGCTVADPNAARDPEESEVSSLSTIAACPTGQWCVETPNDMTRGPRLHAVSAVDASDVFAVGDNGTILRRQDDTEWIAMASGTNANLRSVWAISSSDVWAGGPSGTLLHFDGTSWSSVGAPMPTVDAIWGSSSSNVWFVGSTVVLRWNGSSFTTFGIGAVALASVSGTGPSDVWVSGESANLRRYNGTSWTTIVPGIGSTMWAVLAVATNDVWAAGMIPGRETTHYNGIKWTTIKTSLSSSNTAQFKSMSAEATNDVWGVGNSKIGHWNGTAWSVEEPFGTEQNLWSVSTAPGHVWIVGEGGLIAHRAL